MRRTNMSQRKKWPVIGKITENKGKNGTFRQIQFEENVTIFVDGEQVDMNEYRQANLVTPVQEVEQLIKNGVIEESKQEFRRNKAQEISSWLKHKIIVPPPRG